MKAITVIHSEKGGVGKSTLAAALAAGLAVLGRKVALLDADEQGSLTKSLGFRASPGFYNLLVRDADLKDCLLFVSPEVYAAHGRAEGQLFLMPGNLETRVIPMQVQEVWKLRRRLEQLLKAGVDDIIIDTAPTPSLLHSLIYAAADAIIYPTICERLPMAGLVDSMAHTDEATAMRRPHLGPIRKLAIIPNMYRKSTVEHEENLNLLVRHYGELVWQPLPQRITWAEASGQSRTVFAVAPRSAASREARALVERLAVQ